MSQIPNTWPPPGEVTIVPTDVGDDAAGWQWPQEVLDLRPRLVFLVLKVLRYVLIDTVYVELLEKPALRLHLFITTSRENITNIS